MAAPKTNPGQAPPLPDISEKDPRSLALWKDLAPFLDLIKDEYLVAGEGVSIDRLPGGGRKIGTSRAASDVANQFGSSLIIDGSGNILLQFGVLNGLGLSSVGPDIGGSPIASATSVAVATSGVIGILIEAIPATKVASVDVAVDVDANTSTSTPTYGFDTGGTLVGTPSIVAYTNAAAKDAVRQTATLNTTTGAITANVKEVIVLAEYSSGNLLIPQSQVGPLQLSLCDGEIRWSGPAYFG